MDGRPHPPEWAPHTWQGFSTGEWEGDMLKVTTTHLREGWMRRNGLARSDRADLVEYFVRHHDYLTLFSITYDPVYATAPVLRSSDWFMNEGMQLTPNLCIFSIEIDYPRGFVPHHLPGKNPWLTVCSGFVASVANCPGLAVGQEFSSKAEAIPIASRQLPSP